MTLGSLFDGIGGFPFCAVLSGVTPVWAAEVDPACVAVTKQQFPNMIHLGDVSQINGARYRMLGNSLAIHCALRVIGYIADYAMKKGAFCNDA